MKTLFLSILLFALAPLLRAQDAVVISEGNVERGLIKGTNYAVVALQKEDQSIVQYEAKAVHSFIWNGETYVSKPIIQKKKAVYYFFKWIEDGAVNLYTLGDKKVAPQAMPTRTRVRPSVSIGMGTGGYGGMGGGISIGTGGGRPQTPETDSYAPTGKIFYFIEKPGTGPMVEVSPDNAAALKPVLLQKLSGDKDLAERIKASDHFTEQNLIAFIKAYNASHPAQ